jgi:sulfonate transport system ATP-binding protein
MSLFEIDVDARRFGNRTVLRGVHLALARGEIVSLVGASGCGKSTLLAIAAGLDREAEARVRLDGALLDGPHPAVGFIFQEPRLFPWLSVAENIAFGSGNRKVPAADIAAALDEVGLAGYADALPKGLSGGQAQRVAIARGLFTRPAVLLLDEPFSAVDAITRMKLQDLLLRVARERGLTLLLVTHDIDEAIHLSDRIVLLDRQPGPLRTDLAVTLPRPRARGGAEGALAGGAGCGDRRRRHGRLTHHSVVPAQAGTHARRPKATRLTGLAYFPVVPAQAGPKTMPWKHPRNIRQRESGSSVWLPACARTTAKAARRA